MQAAEKILAMGPKSLVVKHGEYGATAFFSDRSFQVKRSTLLLPFRAPALPLAKSSILPVLATPSPADFSDIWLRRRK